MKFVKLTIQIATSISTAYWIYGPAEVAPGHWSTYDTGEIMSGYSGYRLVNNKTTQYTFIILFN